MYYILEDKIPKKVDLMEWSKWFEKTDRHVNRTNVTSDIMVSTVFLGLDHSYNSGVPILFETMIFGGDHDQFQDRYATWEEAEKGHERAVKLSIIKD